MPGFRDCVIVRLSTLLAASTDIDLPRFVNVPYLAAAAVAAAALLPLPYATSRSADNRPQKPLSGSICRTYVRRT